MSTSKGALHDVAASVHVCSFRLPRPKTATSQIEDTGTNTCPTLFEQFCGFFSKIMLKNKGDKANGLMFSANDTIVCT